jgi:hypothetical protein
VVIVANKTIKSDRGDIEEVCRNRLGWVQCVCTSIRLPLKQQSKQNGKFQLDTNVYHSPLADIRRQSPTFLLLKTAAIIDFAGLWRPLSPTLGNIYRQGITLPPALPTRHVTVTKILTDIAIRNLKPGAARREIPDAGARGCTSSFSRAA